MFSWSIWTGPLRAEEGPRPGHCQKVKKERVLKQRSNGGATGGPCLEIKQGQWVTAAAASWRPLIAMNDNFPRVSMGSLSNIH